MLKAASRVYGAGARWRRQWYARRPERRHALDRPVVSVGNLRVGGTGKTPVVECLARFLLAQGERPAVLSRGYGRRAAIDGATVVADGVRVLADVERAGDEPLMLARAVPGLIVVVGANRFVAGRLAERRFGATVHILDDGFQHFDLARDVDLLLVSEEDLDDRLLPAGRLREPPIAASGADAVIVEAADDLAVDRVGRAFGVETAFRLTRALGAPRALTGAADGPTAATSRVFAVAGIARPERFFAALAAAGWRVVGTMPFRDHHAFRAADLERIATAARASGADHVVTTDKDAVRLPEDGIGTLPIAAIPLRAAIEPAEVFHSWLCERLQ